mmetsp:Transcript_12096/g.37850  ORF Transcript_12096/g.37850 Transcript_12096/m.37850 type:complete len:202 (+) Transcript_12096:2-607(+)
MRRASWDEALAGRTVARSETMGALRGFSARGPQSGTRNAVPGRAEKIPAPCRREGLAPRASRGRSVLSTTRAARALPRGACGARDLGRLPVALARRRPERRPGGLLLLLRVVDLDVVAGLVGHRGRRRLLPEWPEGPIAQLCDLGEGHPLPGLAILLKDYDDHLLPLFHLLDKDVVALPIALGHVAKPRIDFDPLWQGLHK